MHVFFSMNNCKSTFTWLCVSLQMFASLFFHFLKCSRKLFYNLCLIILVFEVFMNLFLLFPSCCLGAYFFMLHFFFLDGILLIILKKSCEISLQFKIKMHSSKEDFICCFQVSRESTNPILFLKYWICGLHFVCFWYFAFCFNHFGNTDSNSVNISQGTSAPSLPRQLPYSSLRVGEIFLLVYIIPESVELFGSPAWSGNCFLLNLGELFPVTVCLALWYPGNGNNRMIKLIIVVLVIYSLK